MPIIRPISDLRNNFNEISEICHKEGRPVYITKNGKGNLVVMSMALYERQKAILDLYEKLVVAEQMSVTDGKRIRHKDVIKALRERLNE